MKHWNKVLVAAAVICGVTGIAWSARLAVSTAYRYSEGRKLVYGTQDDYWSENEPDEEDVFDEEEDAFDEEDGADESDITDGADDVSEEDQKVFGTAEGNCYANEWFNLRLELPESYIMLTGDELGYVQEFGADQFMTEEGQERLEDAKNYGTVRYVMGAVDNSGSVTVNIGIEKVFKSMTIEQYLDLMQKVVERDITDNLGLTFEGITEEKLGGETYHFIHEKMMYDASVGEMHMEQYLRLEDGYVLVMSVGYSADAAPLKDALVAAIQSY